jgi:toxin YhaV
MVAAHGWELFAHPLFLDQLDRLVAAVERERAKKPKTYRSGANAKLLAALHRLIFDVVPQDPARAEYRQGATLGADRKHWFRTKFGGGRFRLFFRFDSKSHIIVYAWVNDETTLRTYGAKTDAYAVFRGTLDKDNPPDNWDALLKAAADAAVIQRFTMAGDASAE